MTANNYITVDTNSVAIPEVWSSMILAYLPNYLNLIKTVNVDFEKEEISQYGNTVNVTKIGTLSVNDKVKGTNVTLQTPTPSTIPIVLDHHKEVTFGEEDVAKIFTKPKLLESYMQQAALILAESVESALAALYTEAENVVDATTGSPVEGMDQAAIRRARRILIQQKVGQNAEIMGYIDPTAVETLPINSALVIGSATPIIEGSIARLGGANLFEGQLVKKAGSPSVAHNMFYTKDAITLIVRPLPDDADKYGGAKQSTVFDEQTGLAIRTTMSYNPNALGAQVTLDILFAVKVMRPEHLVDVKTLA